MWINLTEEMLTELRGWKNPMADQILAEHAHQERWLAEAEAAGVVDEAREVYAQPSDDDLEIDDHPSISPSEDGTWVMAWVWVSKTTNDEEIEE